MTEQKTNNNILYGVAAIFLFWLGDWMSNTYSITAGTAAEKLVASVDLSQLILHPFRLSLRPSALGFGLLLDLAAVLVWLCMKYGKHRLMPQKEYGSARWGTKEDIEPFICKEPEKNIILADGIEKSMEAYIVPPNDLVDPNRNNNVMVIGGSGSKKTRAVVIPNTLQTSCNYIFSDPKGELLDKLGNYLVVQGYKVVVLNLKDVEHSDHYNPLAYIKNEMDILMVVKNLVANMKEDPRIKSSADPIWEEGMTAILEAIFAYTLYELPPEERNMKTVMNLFQKAQTGNGDPHFFSELDVIFDDLECKKPESFAVKQYRLYKMGADRTIQSINITTGMRTTPFNIPAIANIFLDDTLGLHELGTDKKVALFVVTPDSTSAFNFVSAILYQQCFQILMNIADNRDDHSLPRHVQFMLDEFANCGIIPDFQILISTIRSRNIGATIVYQSLAQLKSQYKDDWSTIMENCDSLVLLNGGSNPENLEFYSKLLGKRTIEVMNTSESRGGQGSFTKSYQSLGRELMTPEEIRTMPRSMCIVLITGLPPFFAKKYDMSKHPNYPLFVEANKVPRFDYEARGKLEITRFMENIKTVRTVSIAEQINNL